MIVDAALMQILRGEGEKGRIVAIGNKKVDDWFFSLGSLVCDARGTI